MQIKKYPWLIFASAAMLSVLTVIYAVGQASVDEQLSTGLVTSVRLSAIYFLLAVAIGPIMRFKPIAPLRIIMANRRYLGLGFALLHSVHLMFIILWVRANSEELEVTTLIGGGLAYVLMYLQVLTSNDYSVQKLGKAWGWLHTIAMYYLWLILTLTFAGSDTLTAQSYAALLALAMLVRLAAAIKRRFA